MTYAIEVDRLGKSYGHTRALSGVTFRARWGAVLCLLGPNGAGKSTTVRVLTTLVRPDAGSARVSGFDVVRDPWQVRATIALTGQSATVDELLTGYENIVVMGRLRRLGIRESHRQAVDLLERFGLGDAARRRVSGYSGGMRRRLDIALGLVGDPRVLVLDEPTTGLDPRSRREVWAAVTGYAASGASVLLTTQHLDEADRLADRVVVVDRGTVVAEATPEQLKARAGGHAVHFVMPDADAASHAVRVLTAGGHHPSRVDTAGASVQVPTDGSLTSLRRILALVEDGGVRVEDLALHRPTLDDAFLALVEDRVAAPAEAATR